MYFRSLTLKEIGPFEDLKLDFPPHKKENQAEIHILTGPNGSGKSTILYALGDLFTKESPIFNQRKWNQDAYCKITIEAADEGLHFIETTDTFPSFHKPLGYEIFYGDPIAPDFITVALGYYTCFAYSGNRQFRASQLASIQESSDQSIKIPTFDNNQGTATESLTQWVAIAKTKQALALVKNDRKKAEKWGRAIAQLEATIEEIISVPIEFVLEDDPLSVVLKIDETNLSFDVLPDGVKSILSWIGDCLIRLDRLPWADDCDLLDRNLILLLDEIDIHLHPEWQRKVLPAVQKLFRNGQIFVSTHSPFVVGSVSNAWVHRLTLDERRNAILEESKYIHTGQSYSSILEEIFGIEEEFDVETENQLLELEKLKNLILSGDETATTSFLDLVKELSSKSLELKDIVQRELRQLSRLTGKEFSL